MVDPHVRCRRELDPHRTIREQLGPHQLGLGGTKARACTRSRREVDDYVDSLLENGVQVQVQLMYGNPMYTSLSGVKPDQITPATGSFHNDDRSINSIFWPPKTPDQIAAFLRYVKWMVNHFHGRIHYYALWNEQDIGYWNPWGNPEEYGRLLAAFTPAVHETDPQAKVIYGGQADPGQRLGEARAG